MHLEINDAKISDIDGSNIWQSAQKAYLHTFKSPTFWV